MTQISSCKRIDQHWEQTSQLYHLYSQCCCIHNSRCYKTCFLLVPFIGENPSAMYQEMIYENIKNKNAPLQQVSNNSYIFRDVTTSITKKPQPQRQLFRHGFSP